MPNAYPPLTPAEVRDILRARGFTLARTRSSHEQWTHPDTGGSRRAVTVDSTRREFSVDLVKSMISQSGLSRESFYCSTQRCARKINKKAEL